MSQDWHCHFPPVAFFASMFTWKVKEIDQEKEQGRDHNCGRSLPQGIWGGTNTLNKIRELKDSYNEDCITQTET